MGRREIAVERLKDRGDIKNRSEKQWHNTAQKKNKNDIQSESKERVGYRHEQNKQ